MDNRKVHWVILKAEHWICKDAFGDYELKEGTGVKKPIHCDGWEALPATKI